MAGEGQSFLMIHAGVEELETQIWFDETGRTPEQVNPAMRRPVYEMNRNDLVREAKQPGTRLPDIPTSAADRPGELKIPVLIVVGAHDTPYILAAADYMMERIPPARKVTIQDAAHLPNLDQPAEFKRIVSEFLDEVEL